MKFKIALLLSISCAPLIAMDYTVSISDTLPENFLEYDKSMSEEEKLFHYNFRHLFDNVDEAKPTNIYLDSMRQTLSKYAQLKEASDSAETVEWICNLIHDNGMATYPKITAPLWLGTPQALKLAKDWLQADKDNQTYLEDLGKYHHLMSNFQVILRNYQQIKAEIKNEAKN